MKINFDKPIQFVKDHIHILILLGIVYVAIWLRMATADFDVLLDFDPWWFFRHAENIYENNFAIPVWDKQSFYPPGRPVDFYLGWPYTIAFVSPRESL